MKVASCGRKGFSLIEVALAIGVTGFCLTVLIGLLPVGLASNRESFEQTTAASLANLIVTDLEAAPPTAPASSPQYQISIPSSGAAAAVIKTLFFQQNESALPSSTATATAAQDPAYRATITLTAPPANSRGATVVWIRITWPALADPSANAAPIHYSGSFETITALDRN